MDFFTHMTQVTMQGHLRVLSSVLLELPVNGGYFTEAKGERLADARLRHLFILPFATDYTGKHDFYCMSFKS